MRNPLTVRQIAFPALITTDKPTNGADLSDSEE